MAILVRTADLGLKVPSAERLPLLRVKVTLPDGRVDLYYTNIQPSKFTLDDKRFNARAALVRRDANGKRVAQAEVR